MDINRVKKKLGQFIKKYQYVLLILIVGIVLMTLPEIRSETQAEPQQLASVSELEITEQKLAQILSSIEGVGQVRVMLTLRKSAQTVYQTDEDRQSDAADYSSSHQTVTVTDAQRNETGLVVQTIAPEFLGAMVICQGASSPSVRLSILDAVSKITGLRSDQISILKMQ